MTSLKGDGMSMFKWIRGTVVAVSVAATFGAAAQVTPVRYQLCEPDVPPPGTVLNLQTNYRYPASVPRRHRDIRVHSGARGTEQ
jgi:hypothetical protein